MNIKQIIIMVLLIIILVIMGSLPLWWDDMAPSIFGFPAYLVAEINGFMNAIKWFIDQLFG